MALEKILNARFALKIDTYANWTDETLGEGKGALCVLKHGEVGFCEIPSGNTEATTAPTILFKVGDGTSPFKSLKWASALAADVYAWAKKGTPDWNDFPALPLTVVDNETDQFITYFEYADNTLTIHRGNVDWNDIQNKPNLINSVKTTDDDVVVLAPETAASGDVTITGTHAKKGPTGGYTGTQAEKSINAFGQSIEIAVPKLGVDEYGHTNTADEVKYTITLPTPEAAINTVTTLTEGEGIDIEDLATDGNHNYKVSHANTSNIADITKEARKYVAGVVFDDFGHVTAIEMGEEVDQEIPVYNIVKDSTSEYAATYHLTKDGVNIGAAINIPKDMVVEHGEVKTLEAGTPWGDAGTYIILTLANATSDKLYINVGDLIEYVTGGTTADIVVSVNEETHMVTADLTTSVKTDIAKGVSAKAVTDTLKALAFKDTIGTGLIDNFEADVKAITVDNAKVAANATNLGGIAAGEYLTKNEAQGTYRTETQVNNQIDAKIGDLGTAVQSVTSVEGNGIKTTRTGNNIVLDWDTDVVFVFNAGSSTTVI